MNISDTLLAAAADIETNGHWGGDWRNGEGDCAANAISIAAGGIEAAQPAQLALAEHIGGQHVWDIFDWNDKTPATDVIAAMRAAALIAQAREDQDAAFATYADVVQL